MRNGEFSFYIDNFFVKRVCSINSNIESNSIIFSKKYNSEIISKIYDCRLCIIILPESAKNIIPKQIIENNKIIFAENTRLEYAKLMQKIEKENFEETSWTNIPNSVNSICGTKSKIAAGARIGANVVIENYVKIGENCTIGHGVKILENVIIGDNVVVKPNAVIGGGGFGVERDQFGRTYKIPHIGGVIIGDWVEIGALTTVCSGTISPTIIGKYTKIDDHVHVGHNVQIKESVLVTACVELSRAEIGSRSWIGPNSSVIQGVTLAENSFVGIGSVVTKSVKKDQIVAGNPAQDIDELKKIRKKLKELIDES